MKKLLLLFVPVALILASCGNGDEGNGQSGRTAKGDRVYGGTFRLNETEKYQTLYPISITDVISSNIAFQVYEGLVKFNPKDVTRVMPAIAESWSMDSSGTVYTFHLRKGVKFHDDPCFADGKGREVKASDFKYSFELACSNSSDNANFAGTFSNRIKGANDYNTGKANEVSGIKSVDDNTLQITLDAPSSSFLYVLAGQAGFVVPKEAVEKYGNQTHIGTGPFSFVEPSDKTDGNVVLVSNPNYYGTDTLGNQLPFLDSVIISFMPKKTDELEAFKKGDLDVVVGLPAESINEMVQSQISDFQNKPPKYILDRTPEMESQYYEFNTTRAPFNNVKVRQAFSYAIDRDKIIENVLNGEAYGPGIFGICPQGLQGYDNTKDTMYMFNPEKAKKLLAEAGYPNGKNFPTVKIELNSGGAKHARVVDEIQKQLKDVLNVNIDYDIVPFKQKLEDSKYARSDIFRSAWVADFPSPENFLWTLYGANVPDSLSKPSYPNIPRYKNAEYDKEFDAGKSAKTKNESYAHFLKAEKIMMQDAPIMMLWYGENLKLAHYHVKNFSFNPMNFRSMAEVYIKKETSSPAAEKTETK